MVEYLLYWLIFANFAGFVAMLWDKASAQAERRRIAESTLIMWSIIGGSIGVLAAAIIARHKTRKQPMATIIKVVPVLHLIAAYLWFSGYAESLIPASFGEVSQRP